MTKTKTVWKVVRSKGGKRASAIILRAHGGIEYSEPGQPTIAPEGTKLLAFKTRRAAMDFCWRVGHEVWKAEAKDVRKQNTIASTDFATYKRFVYFWSGAFSPLVAPQGTVSCSELTLLEKIN